MIHDEVTNNKLLILFILDKFETPVSEEVLLDICSVDNQWIPFFICKQLVIELIRSGFIANASKANVSLLTITTDGRTCLSHFYNDIALSMREDITEFIKEKRVSYRKKQEFLADYYRNNDSTFTVALKILEVSQPVLDLKFVVASRAIAMSVYNSWKEKAADVYSALHDILVES